MLAKLTDICDIQYGYAFDSAKFSETEGVPLVRIRDVLRGFSETKTTEDFPSAYTVSNGDILIGMDGEFNIAKWQGGSAALNQRVCRLIPRKVNPDYVFHFMPSALKRIEEKTPFVTVKHLSAKELNRIVVPLPDKEEQDRIANILNDAANLVSYRKHQLQTLDQLIKARFVELFGDPITNSKGFETRPGIEVFKLSNGKFVPENKRFVVGVPVYGGNGISWYTDEILCANDTVVVGRVGFQSGNVHLVEGPLWISDNAMYISDLVDDEYDLRFLYAVMDHIDFTRFQDAGDLKKITQKPFMQMQYIKPPLNIQREYIAFVSQVDKSKLSIQASLDQLETMKQSLMQKYFILGECKSP